MQLDIGQIDTKILQNARKLKWHSSIAYNP